MGTNRCCNSILRIFFFCVGFTPIAMLATALVGLVPLHWSVFLLIPVLGMSFLIGMEFPRAFRLALWGVGVGMVSTLIYDTTRWPFVVMGLWPDFIPKIGAALWNGGEGHSFSGYVWRYFGNGGGMGLAFVMVAPWIAKYMDVRKGAILYGTLIWCCLLGTLYLCPDAHRMMFDLTPLSFVVSLVGHWVYGATLGLLVYRRVPRRRAIPV